MESFNNKVNEAAAKYLIHRGYDIIEETWKREGGMLPVDIVAEQDEAIVFVSTKGRNAEKGADKFDDGNPDRNKLEAFAIKWFTEHVEEYDNRPFRFDIISILVIGEDAHKALLRHHINAMSISIPTEETQTSDSSEEEAQKTSRAA